MKKHIASIVLVVFACGSVMAEESQDMWTMQDDTAFYNSLTKSADYTSKPVFKPMAYTGHDLVEDIKVTAVESIPFGFIYTFAGLWVAKAIKDKTWSPNVGSLSENQGAYFTCIGAFMAVNVCVNIFTFYDYTKNKKGDAVEKKDKALP